MSDASVNGQSQPKVKAKRKAAPKATAKAAKASKTAKKAATRKADPTKLDKFGLRLGSIKSQAAAMYAAKKGATLADVRDAVGSVQFNVITELEGKGFTIERTEVPGRGARMATKYHLLAR